MHGTANSQRYAYEVDFQVRGAATSWIVAEAPSTSSAMRGNAEAKARIHWASSFECKHGAPHFIDTENPGDDRNNVRRRHEVQFPIDVVLEGQKLRRLRRLDMQMFRQRRKHINSSIVPITSVRHCCTSTLQMREECEVSRTLVFIFKGPPTSTPAMSNSLSHRKPRM